MLDRLETFLRRIRYRFSRSGYGGRYVGHHRSAEDDGRPGVILIQVDGLGESVLRLALDRGQMPFLGQLVSSEGYQIRSLYSGLPSSTPGFQAELFYGAVSAVPAFGYRDPVRGRILSMNDPASAAAIEGELAKKHSGLLRNGAAWSNVFTGGAAEAHLCASTSGLRSLFSNLSPGRFFTILPWYAWSISRVLGNFVAVCGLAVWDLFRGKLGFRGFFRELRFVPLRILVSVIMREIVAAGAAIDAWRGLPVIQLNLLGYDEHAHRRGPRSRFALWSLRGVDKAIRRVWLAGHRSQRRDYQVWLYSDHGQEEVVPYPHAYGRSVPDVVREIYEDLVAGREPIEPLVKLPQRADSGDEAVESSMPTFGRSRWIVRPGAGARARERARARSGDMSGGDASGGDTSADPGRPDRIVTTNQGPAGFVYFPREHDAEFRHRMARLLVALGRIPAVLLRAELEPAPGEASEEPPELAILVVTLEGEYRLSTEAGGWLGESHPHLEAVAQDLIGLFEHNGSGDLMLVGWNPTQPLSLQSEHGSHGGPGPEETSAFVLVPPEAHALAAIPDSLRPRVLRQVLLQMMERPFLDVFDDAEVESRPVYQPPTLVVEDGVTTARLRVMTYNVHGCRGTDGSYDTDRIVRVIARERPDLICLQEVDQERTRSGGVDQILRIASRLKQAYHFHAVSELDDGRFGNAVLSSLPLRLVEQGALPNMPTAKEMLGLWDRGALRVALELSGAGSDSAPGAGVAGSETREIQVINTHLSIFPMERTQQVEALLGSRWLGACEGPTLIAGDFNAAPDSKLLRRFEPRFRSVVDPSVHPSRLQTWTGSVPLRRLDHILTSAEITSEAAYVPRSRTSRVASDHLPLVADLVVRF